MAISRRKFLAAGTVAAVYAGVPLKALANDSLVSLASPGHSSTGGRSSFETPAYLTREKFAAHLNTNFNLANQTSKTVVKLIRVKDLARGKENDHTGKECFSLLFCGPRKMSFEQDTYTFTHDALGTFAALTVPVRQDKQGRYYEVIFNRLY